MSDWIGTELLPHSVLGVMWKTAAKYYGVQPSSTITLDIPCYLCDNLALFDTVGRVKQTTVKVFIGSTG